MGERRGLHAASNPPPARRSRSPEAPSSSARPQWCPSDGRLHSGRCVVAPGLRSEAGPAEPTTSRWSTRSSAPDAVDPADIKRRPVAVVQRSRSQAGLTCELYGLVAMKAWCRLPYAPASPKVTSLPNARYLSRKAATAYMSSPGAKVDPEVATVCHLRALLETDMMPSTVGIIGTQRLRARVRSSRPSCRSCLSRETPLLRASGERPMTSRRRRARHESESAVRRGSSYRLPSDCSKCVTGPNPRTIAMRRSWFALPDVLP